MANGHGRVFRTILLLHSLMRIEGFLPVVLTGRTMVDLTVGDMGYDLIGRDSGLQSVGVSSEPSALLIVLLDDARVTGIDPFGVTRDVFIRLRDLKNFLIFRISVLVFGHAIFDSLLIFSLNGSSSLFLVGGTAAATIWT
jgi:hypothetical protein